MSTLGVATGTSSNSERSERDEAQPSGRADAPVRAFYLASVSPARRLPYTLGPTTRRMLRLTKIEAALRQLNRAIQMLFHEDDPVCTHTLAGAASVLLTDLVEKLAPEHSWDRMAQEDNNLGQSQYFKVVRNAQNFLKHARVDHADTLEFDPQETEALLLLAVMNASEIAPMSHEAQVYQLWALARQFPAAVASESPFREAVAYFGDLRHVPRPQRLALGRRALQELRAQ